MKNLLFAGKKILSRLFLTLTLPWLFLITALILPEYPFWLIGAVVLFMEVLDHWDRDFYGS